MVFSGVTLSTDWTVDDREFSIQVQLDDTALQLYKDGDYGSYLDLEASINEQQEEFEDFQTKSWPRPDPRGAVESHGLLLVEYMTDTTLSRALIKTGLSQGHMYSISGLPRTLRGQRLNTKQKLVKVNPHRFTGSREGPLPHLKHLLVVLFFFLSVNYTLLSLSLASSVVPWERTYLLSQEP
uniref:FHOD1 N-terminal GTPase-binding domain-containing protein n=1 Tax=Timema bartmani TaxID=61472 RepID=A0A7R9HWA1_9NEOP|nr:unnamed protein product [Timema bartmani]